MERQLRNGKRTTLDDVVTSLKKRALVDTDRPRPNSPRPPPTAFQSIPPTALAQRVLKKFTAIYPSVSFSMAEPIDLTPQVRSTPEVPSSPRSSSPSVLASSTPPCPPPSPPSVHQPLASSTPEVPSSPRSSSPSAHEPLASSTPPCPPPSPPSAQELLPPTPSSSQTFTPASPPLQTLPTGDNFRVFREGKETNS
jgi:hypothetical protein